MNQLPKSISVTINYCPPLAKITKTKSETAVVSKDLPFLLMLNFVFQSYPDIQTNYPPGKIGLLLNNQPPAEMTLLQDGDEISLIAY